jgi:hypothetical protein
MKTLPKKASIKINIAPKSHTQNLVMNRLALIFWQRKALLLFQLKNQRNNCQKHWIFNALVFIFPYCFHFYIKRRTKCYTFQIKFVKIVTRGKN